ncbi:MAG: SDR family oxidoreductase [Simkaniaceae bacterium]|nr:SDR family oxidoreductase [Simkaniaceae bacterium]
MKKLLFFTLCSLTLLPAKNVLITGATRGVGKATAEHFAQNGYRVYATGRSAVEYTSDQIKFLKLDVTDEKSIQEAVDAMIKTEGSIDLVINNAGAGIIGPLEASSIDDYRHQMELHCYGPIRLCHTVLPHMRAKKSGHIITVTSGNAVFPAVYGSAYSASKAAIESVMEVLSVEVDPWNIAISIVEPGMLTTDFSIKSASKKPDAYTKVLNKLDQYIAWRSENHTSLCEAQSPEEIAQFLLAVASNPAPKKRYQTHPRVTQLMENKIADLDGSTYFKIAKQYKEKAFD